MLAEQLPLATGTVQVVHVDVASGLRDNMRTAILMPCLLLQKATSMVPNSTVVPLCLTNSVVEAGLVRAVAGASR